MIEPGRKNLYLVGLMGAGKSTIGRHLARELGREFVDADHEIEQRTGVTIATIFDIEGEASFRRRESEVLRDISKRDDVVVATGGGVVLAEKNCMVLRETGFVVYLETPPAILKKRAARSKGRPLLDAVAADARAKKVEQLLRKRGPLYRDIADLVVTPGESNAPIVAKQIARAMAKKLCKESK